MKYDTLIIGAGLSGLAAGIRLAYYDQSVGILERHTTIGGLNSFYRLRGRNYDVGLHAITNYAEPGTKKGPLSKLLRQLRLSWDDFALCPQNFSTVEFPGHAFRFTNEFAELEADIEREFPNQIDGFRSLVSVINEFNELDLGQEPLSARRVLEDHLNNPLLIDMLFCPLMFYGSAIPDDMDFSQFVIMFKAIFEQGFGRPFKGVRQIMKPITRKFKELGGDLKLRHGVKEIVIDNGRAVGVITDDGVEIQAERILSSAGSAETLAMCSSHEMAEESSADYRPGELSFCEIIYTLDCLPSELGHDSTIVFYSDSKEFHYAVPKEPCDVRSGIICSPNNFQYGEGNQLDEGVMRVTALAQPDFWFAQQPDDYEAAKQEWERKIYESALGHMPDFRDHIVDIDMFTPTTITRFTGHQNGAVYGAPHKILQGTTPVENLFLCGTDQGFLGIIGSMLSGITMANNHCLPR